MRVAFVSAEAHPWAKTGGLGDVVGSLPAALKRVDPELEVCVFLPLYERARAKLRERGIEPELTGIEVAARLFGRAEIGRIQRWTDDDGVIWAFVELCQTRMRRASRTVATERWRTRRGGCSGRRRPAWWVIVSSASQLAARTLTSSTTGTSGRKRGLALTAVRSRTFWLA